MAKAIKKKDVRRKRASELKLPLSKENFLILGAGILIIILGYLALLENSVEGFLPLVVSPVLLILGYCVVIPIGILYRKPRETKPSSETQKI